MDPSAYVPVEKIAGDDEEETRLLSEMAREARTFITAFSWCPDVTSMRLAYGIGGVVALFLVEFSTKIAGTDERLWIVVGDLPSAYMVVEADDSPQEALSRYCELMDDWVEAVLRSHDFTNVYPVEAARTRANADALHSRLAFVRGEIIPRMNAPP